MGMQKKEKIGYGDASKLLVRECGESLSVPEKVVWRNSHRATPCFYKTISPDCFIYYITNLTYFCSIGEYILASASDRNNFILKIKYLILQS
jgi:hypothetical protein